MVVELYNIAKLKSQNMLQAMNSWGEEGIGFDDWIGKKEAWLCRRENQNHRMREGRLLKTTHASNRKKHYFMLY